jgi:hypothetical protein
MKPEEIKKLYADTGRKGGLKRWAKVGKKERSKYGKMMADKRYGKHENP